MQTDTPYLSVVIPAYNEASRIGPTLSAICSWLAKQSYRSEVIVVNNNSHDATRQVAEGFSRQFPFISVIDEKRPGKGYAVVTGMLSAHGAVRLFTDADNATSIDHVERMLPFLDQGYDVVIGSLAVPGAKVLAGGAEPWWRVVLGKLGNLWIQAWAVPGIWDTQRGFKVFTQRATERIFSHMHIFGWGFDVEVLALARGQKFRIREAPVSWHNDPDSKVNIWAYPKVLLDTVKVGLRRIAGMYRGSLDRS